MKMKITKSILMAVALVALSAQSCKDFLDEELVSNVAADSYYSTPAGLEDGADAAYSFLREIYSNERSYITHHIWYRHAHERSRWWLEII